MILLVGEILIDQIGRKINNTLELENHVGGAPFNVASNLINLGAESTFVGSIGNDAEGRYILENIPKSSRFVGKLHIDQYRKTTIAQLIKDENGLGKFTFVRNDTADYHLNFKDAYDSLNDCNIVHLGSLFLSDLNAQEEMYKFVKYAKSLGKLISFDVNYREDIYNEGFPIIESYKKFIELADILKISQSELGIITGEKDLEKGLITLKNHKIILITLDSKGSACYYKGNLYKVSTNPVKVVDSVGAGDSFLSGVLYNISNYDIDNLSEEQINYMLRFANACGGLTCLTAGAINAYSSKEEVLKQMEV